MIKLLPDHKGITESLYPFLATRNSWDLRMGILTLKEKWEYYLGAKFQTNANGELQMPHPAEATREHALVGNWIPSPQLAEALLQSVPLLPEKILEFPWQVCRWNDWALREDFELVTRGRVSAPIPESVRVIEPGQVFLESGVRMENCHINASTGPVYIGRNAEIMEGAMIRGPFSLGEGSIVKMGATIYGATTIGPYCTIGGELKNVVMLGYSNKAHEGYLGDSVIGEWCNLGAGTTVSNMRNTGGPVKVWWQPENEFIPAGLKCGLLMGDYSRSAINTSFNTATVVGVCAHVFGAGLTPKLIRDFTWGMDGTVCYAWEKALRHMANWKQLKQKTLENDEIRVLKAIFTARWGGPSNP